MNKVFFPHIYIKFAKSPDGIKYFIVTNERIPVPHAWFVTYYQAKKHYNELIEIEKINLEINNRDFDSIYY